MGKNRLEAMSDGVIAIILTIMVLEMKVPHGADFASLRGIFPVFLSYVLSFTNVGIYWNNHHHLFQITKRVSGGVLWANLHLLFWLSLVPFTTGWMGENHFARLPTALYGVNLLLAAVAYLILQLTLIRHGNNPAVAKALGDDVKGKLSCAIYAAAIPLAYVHQWIAGGLYALVAAIWLVPDTRIEKKPGNTGTDE